MMTMNEEKAKAAFDEQESRHVDNSGSESPHDCLSDPVHSPRASDFLSHIHEQLKATDKDIFLIGIAGGSASGKTSVSQ
jgi:hypothetical protein